MDTMTDPNGNLITHAWDENGRIIEEVDGIGGSYRFLRNVGNGETFYSTVYPEGETSTSRDTRLANGDTVSTMTLPTGESITATFAKDQSSTSTLRDGIETVYTYTSDSLTHQRILASKQITQPSGLKQTTTYTTVYDGNETHTNTKSVTITVNAKSTTDVTDYNAGVQTITTPEGRSLRREYDTDTLLTQSITAGTLAPTAYSYDTKGRLTKAMQADRETLYTYDNRGNLASVTDPRGRVTTYSYDIMDRLTTVTHPDDLGVR